MSRRRVAVIAATLAIALPATSAGQSAGSPGPPADIEALGWLAGAWMNSEHPEAVQEVWLAPQGGLMLGVHRDTRGSRPFFEYLRIEVVRDGDASAIVYWASPLGRPATPFRMTQSSPGRARFENPDHDFPQRLEYVRDGTRLEMTASGSGRTERWTMVLDGSPWR